MTQDKEFRPVNQILGAKPSLGPIPADQVIPWITISLLSYFLSQILFNLGWTWTILLAVWGFATWWILTGKSSWRFLSKFVSIPNWTRGVAQYHSFLEQPNYEKQNRKKKSQRKRHRK
jgi:hypothetical protein